MKALDFPLLADENLHPQVVEALAGWGKQVRSVFDEGLASHEDVEILRFAHARQWVVLTHDNDFGALSIRMGEPFTGIVYLRPGHIEPAFVVDILEAVESLPVEVVPPFLLVAERKGATVRLRLRSTPHPAS
jgi:predicted nuclease of predicted toxin-antitoxin system